LVKRGIHKRLLVKSFAKLNLGLLITAKRSDGYHELKTIFQEISLYDDVTVRLSESGVTMKASGADVPCDKANIMVQAAEKILYLSGKKNGIALDLKKRIPIGAGLGGGSSNAATVLKAVNSLLELGYSNARLREIAIEIGADVPFFIEGGTSLGMGVGEVLSPVTIPRFWATLVYPNINISTAYAYSRVKMRLTSKTDSIRIALNYASNGDLGGFASSLSNDMEDAVCPEYKLVYDIKNILLSMGALGSIMSGSGSSVFGIFSCLSHAKASLPILCEALHSSARIFVVSSDKCDGFEEYSPVVPLEQVVL